MAVKIRLARGGRKNRPYYTIVVADGRAPRDGRFLEKVGRYNPMLPVEHPERVIFDSVAITQWLSKGAQPTDRVAIFLEKAGLMPARVRNNPVKAVSGKKRAERKAKKAAAAAPAEAG
jgi:small subunit ribosomal protein S16